MKEQGGGRLSFGGFGGLRRLLVSVVCTAAGGAAGQFVVHAEESVRSVIRSSLLGPLLRTFGDGNVPINWEVRESLRCSVWLRPLYFQCVYP